MSDCLFCHLPQESWLTESEHFYVVFDIAPIQDGHMLLISKQHRQSLQDLSAEESSDLLSLQKGLLEDEECHFHCHLTPRVKDDGFWDKIDVAHRHFPKESLLKEL